MTFQKFELPISKNSHNQIFPLPENNHYQNIQKMRVEPKAKALLDIPGALLAVFAPNTPSVVAFEHEPLEIKKNVRDLDFVIRPLKSFEADDFISHRAPKIRALAKKWKAETHAKRPYEIVEAFYYQVLNFLEYGSPTLGLYTWKEALNSKVTDCGGFATLLASVLQAEGLVCRIAVGHLYRRGWKTKLKMLLRQKLTFADVTMHAWLEVQETNGEWCPLDPSVEWKRLHGQSKRLGGLGHTAADRLLLSFGHQHLVNYKNKPQTFPLLQHIESLG